MMPNLPDLSGFVSAAAGKYNLDPSFVNAVVQQESSGNPKAWNKSGGGQGAAGAMQVRGPALSDYNQANGTSYKMSDLLDPSVGIEVGSWYLNQQLNRFGDPARALAAYKDGAASPAAQQGTSAYAQQVLSRIGSPSTAPTPAGGADTSGYGGSAGGAAQSGGPPGAQGGAAALLAQFGYGADGQPATPAAGPQGAPSAPQNAAQQGATPGQGAAAGLLAKFGYGPDGNPTAQAPAPASRSPASPAPGTSGTAAPAQPSQQQKVQQALGDIMGVSTPEQAADWRNYLPGGIVSGLNRVVTGADQFVAHSAKAAADLFGPAPAVSSTGAVQPRSGLAGLIDRWSAAADSAAAALPQNSPDSLSGKAGEFIGESLPTLWAPGGSALQAAVGGGLAGVIQPVTSNADSNYWAQKGVQTGLGAAGAGVVHGALSKASSMLAARAAKANPDSPLLAQIRGALGGEPIAAQPQAPVPGVQPTLADLTQNANLGAIQRNLAETNPQAFAERGATNAAARQQAFDAAVGTPADAATAAAAARSTADAQYAGSGIDQLTPDPELASILQRPSMAPVMKRAELLADESGAGNPFQAQRDALQAQHNQMFSDMAGTPEAVQAAKDARNADVFDRYQAAGAQEIPVDENLSMLLQRPSMQSVVARAQRLADEEGAGPIFIHDEDGAPVSLSGDSAHYIKQGLDDEIQLARDNNLGASERRAITNTQNQFLGWLDNQSPDYAGARASYAQQTQPIEAQEYLQGLNVTDANGNVTLPKIDSAIKKTEQLRATPGLNAAKNLTDAQMSQLYALRDGLRTAAAGPDVSAFTPAQIQYVQRALDDELAKGTAGATANQNAALQTSRDQLEQWLGSRAPDYLASKQTAQAGQQKLMADQWLQHDITDSMGRLNLNSVERKVKQIEAARKGESGSIEAARYVDDDTLEQLRAVRDSLRDEKITSPNAKSGSPTSQNTKIKKEMGMNRPDPEAGALAGGLSRAAGWGIGGAAGWTLGNLVAPGVGTALGPLVGASAGGALERAFARRAFERASDAYDARIGRLTDIFLNPTAEHIAALNGGTPVSNLQRMIDMARGVDNSSGLRSALTGQPATRVPKGLAAALGGQGGSALFNVIKR
ncbi:transglycosylase SLT domain-containing protein [Burkholderia glumae]|uniref:transglycosylase SLT domain-containing protein n=1 Tax=Burkholderia glumae TaxID=337 RepID=UPI002150AE2B|nr:transglycosylase SLT domain-containing protein [Burkholderia glumae]